jgi:OTU domain-containing protein 6
MKNKSKLRKERKIQEFENARKEAEKEAESMENSRLKETEKLYESLLNSKLKIFQVKSDGHCLYHAIEHQLLIHQQKTDFHDLRKLTAEYIRKNSEDFIPFLLNDSGMLMDSHMIEQYLYDLEFGCSWGGHVEIMALSRVLERPIYIYQVDPPLMVIGQEFTLEPLRISYHRHEFGLGEHYNSVVDIDHDKLI